MSEEQIPDTDDEAETSSPAINPSEQDVSIATSKSESEGTLESDPPTTQEERVPVDKKQVKQKLDVLKRQRESGEINDAEFKEAAKALKKALKDGWFVEKKQATVTPAPAASPSPEMPTANPKSEVQDIPTAPVAAPVHQERMKPAANPVEEPAEESVAPKETNATPPIEPTDVEEPSTPETTRQFDEDVDKLVETIVSAMVSMADRHYHDGKLSVIEMQTFLAGNTFQDFTGWLLKMRTNPETGVREYFFYKYDADRSGSLTADELTVAMADYIAEALQDRTKPELVQRMHAAAKQHFAKLGRRKVKAPSPVNTAPTPLYEAPKSPARMIRKHEYHNTHICVACSLLELASCCGGLNPRWGPNFQEVLQKERKQLKHCGEDEEVELSKPHRFCIQIQKRLVEMKEMVDRGEMDTMSDLLPSLIRLVYKNKGSKDNNYTFTAPGKSTIKMSFGTSDSDNRPCLECFQLFDYVLPAFKNRVEAYRIEGLTKRAAEIEEGRQAAMRQKQAEYNAKKEAEQRAILEKQERKRLISKEKRSQRRIHKAMQVAAAEEQARRDLELRDQRRLDQKQREAKRHNLFQKYLRSISPAHDRTPSSASHSDAGTPTRPLSAFAPTADMSPQEHMSWIADLRNRALTPPPLVPQLCTPKQAKLQALSDDHSVGMVPRVQYEYGSTGFPSGRHVELRPVTVASTSAESSPAVPPTSPEIITPEDTPPLQPKPSPQQLEPEPEDQEDAPTGALANLHAEIQARNKRALAKQQSKPGIFKEGPVRDRCGMTLTFDQVRDEIEQNKKKFKGLKAQYAYTMSLRLQADHTGIQQHVDLREKVDVRRLTKLCGLPSDHIRKMCDIFDREVPKSRAKVKGGDAPQNMSRVQFHRFMQKNGYQDKAIVSRLFEVFDSKKDNELSFEELLMGLAFFEDRPGGSEKFLPGNMSKEEAEDADSDDTFLDVCSRFFDLDGKTLISKLNIFKVLCPLMKRERAKHVADAIFDLLTLDKTLLTYTEFIEGACAQPELCTVFYKMMLLQGKQRNSKAFNLGVSSLLEMTQEWAEAHESGRLVGLDKLVAKFQEADFQGEIKILQEMRSIQKLRKDANDNSESVDYYAHVMAMIIEKGWGFVEVEQGRLAAGIQAAGDQATDDNMESQMSKIRLLKKWTAILGQYQPLYIKPLQPGQSMGLKAPAEPPTSSN